MVNVITSFKHKELGLLAVYMNNNAEESKGPILSITLRKGQAVELYYVQAFGTFDSDSPVALLEDVLLEDWKTGKILIFTLHRFRMYCLRN